MSSTVKMHENNVAEIAFDISKEDFNEALQKAFRKNSKKFSIPGFRPGKAPINIVTKYYGEAVLYDDAIEYVAEEAYPGALEEHSLEPVSRPQIEEISEIGSDKGMKFTIKVTTKPDVTLGQYKDLDVSKKEVKITAKMVDAELEKIQERNARMIPVEDRPVMDGDTANIDYEGFLEDEPFEGGKGTSYDLRIGSNTFIPGFEEQVIGKNIGEEFDLNITFPEDYHSEELKGKEVVFKVKVNSISKKELPEADDEFAKDVSEFDTIEEYKKSLKDKLTEDAEKSAESEYEEKLIQTVVDNATVEVPEVMVDNEVDRMINEQSSRMKYQGIELEQYLQYTGQDMDTFRESLKEGAGRQVKTNLVMEVLGKELGFEISEDDVEEEINRVAEQYNMKAEDIKKQFEGSESYFNESIIFRKTMDYLKDNAKPNSKTKAKKEKTAKKTDKNDTIENNEE